MVAGISAISFSMMPRTDKFVTRVTNVKGVTLASSGRQRVWSHVRRLRAPVFDTRPASECRILQQGAYQLVVLRRVSRREPTFARRTLTEHARQLHYDQDRRQLRRGFEPSSEATSRKAD
jgi:hypothetical protein